MTCKIEPQPQRVSTDHSCGSQASKHEAAPAVAAKPQAAPSSAVKRSAPAEAAGSCCHSKGHSDADHR